MEIGLRKKLLVHQVFEAWELLGYETRNKYEILDEDGSRLGYAAEQQKGIFGFLMRQALGHWRKFDIHFYDNDRKEFMVAHHPFRFYFRYLEVKDMNGRVLGSLEKRFSIFTKKFDLKDAQGNTVMSMRSPIWKPWTYPLYTNTGREIALILKKFSGILNEMFTDKDNFLVEYNSKLITEEQRKVILATSVYIDLIYFERKAGTNKDY